MNKRVLTYFYIVVGFVLMLTVSGCTDYQAGEDAYNRGDYETAFKKFLPLAEQGDARAQVYLGLMYANGEGVPQNDTEAVKWLRLAADQKKAHAQCWLGYMYENGKGVSQDYVLALMWLNLAVAQGDADSAKRVEKLEKEMTPNQIAEAQRLAREWKAKGN